LIEKLFVLVNGKTSQGVFNVLKEEVIGKGVKFTQKALEKLDLLQLIQANGLLIKM
jgi:DNA-directed RNA polymerase subunit beta